MDYYFLRYPIPYYKDPTDRRSNHQDVIAGMNSGKYLSDKEWVNLRFEKEHLQLYKKKIKNDRK
jgi:hypothetical protein